MNTHEWNVTPKEAVAIQKELQSKIIIEEYSGEIKTIAGADISLNMFSDIAYAGIIVLSYPDLIPIGHAVVKSKINFPYIPGLLSFREIPALMKAWNILKKKNLIPDILVVDGQGTAHPRGMGIASHFGYLLNHPTIGCAKSILYGTHNELPETPGSVEYLLDTHHPEKTIGALVRTKQRTKPIIVSPGYKIDLEQSIEIMKNCGRGYRIPEPTRLAHNLVNDFRTGKITE